MLIEVDFFDWTYFRGWNREWTFWCSYQKPCVLCFWRNFHGVFCLFAIRTFQLKSYAGAVQMQRLFESQPYCNPVLKVRKPGTVQRTQARKYLFLGMFHTLCRGHAYAIVAFVEKGANPIPASLQRTDSFFLRFLPFFLFQFPLNHSTSSRSGQVELSIELWTGAIELNWTLNWPGLNAVRLNFELYQPCFQVQTCSRWKLLFACKNLCASSSIVFFLSCLGVKRSFLLMSELDQMDQGEEGELPVESAESGESAAVHFGGRKPEKTLLPLPAPAFLLFGVCVTHPRTYRSRCHPHGAQLP